MGFKLNIGKDGGGGTSGFSLKQSLNMIKAKGMSSQMVGTDVMKDGYYNTVNESGAGSPALQTDDEDQNGAGGKIATEELKEVIVEAKSPKTIADNVQQNRDRSTRNSRYVDTPQEQKEVDRGKYSRSKVPISDKEYRIFLKNQQKIS